MTKTIEERAREYANEQAGGEYHTGFEGAVWQEYYERYKEIATEQRKIDIEKACIAYCKMCDINCDSGDTCNGLEMFKKYMNEEQ